MSLSFIMNSSQYAVKKGKSRKPRTTKRGMKYRGGDKRVMESKSRLLDGTVKKCLHYQNAPVKCVTKVSGTTVTLGDESTYTEAMLKEKNAEYVAHNPKEPIHHDVKKRNRCGNVTRRINMRTRKNGLRVIK